MTMVQDRRAGAAASTPPVPISILLVEDNLLDARAAIRAAQKLELAETVEVVTDGQAALDRLRNDRAEGDPFGLVLLDLNLPGKDGHDVLEEIRADAELRTIPVVVLTSSTEPSDVDGAYRRGANAYVPKPSGLDGWLQVMGTIREFWLTLAVLPGR